MCEGRAREKIHAAFVATRKRAAHRRGIDRHRRPTDRAPSRPHGRARLLALLALSGHAAFLAPPKGKSKAKKASLVPTQGACRRPRKEKSRTSVNPPPGTPPPARRSSRSTRTRASSIKVKDVGKINFFIYYFTRWTGDTSKHSLQSST